VDCGFCANALTNAGHREEQENGRFFRSLSTHRLAD